MKTLIRLSTILILTTFLMSCKKEETPLPTFPKNTDYKSFIGYIDGLKFQPINENVYIDTNRDGNVLIKRLIATIDNKAIIIQFTAEQTGSYTLTGGTTGYDNGTYNVGLDSSWVCTTSAGGGNLVITKYDKENNKISGTYNFKAKMFGTSSVKNITNGAFFDIEIR